VTQVTVAHLSEESMRRVEQSQQDRARPAARLRSSLLAWTAALAALVVLPGVALAGEAHLVLPTVAFASDTLLALNDGAEPPALPDLDASGLSDDDAWLDDEFSLDDEYDDITADDPLERLNRGVFAFNRQVDRFVLTPVTDVYRTLVPTPGRQGVYNVFRNLDSPSRMTNALLQGRPKAAGITLGRFVFNSTFGLGGLFDIGTRVGLKRQQADFGQTLATWGTPQGPYLIFPFLGPMTVRHGIGMGADLAMQPASWVLGPLPGMIMGASKDFTRREQHAVELETLRDTSLDFYAALRSAFLQDRADVVAAGSSDAQLEHMADEGSDPAIAALSPEAREARCLTHPRSRRDLAKPGLRRATRLRCAGAASAF
jgi:phospholipid-binding lipoprotein MlaA